jgi:3-isopropylmalate dehydratase small subunit
VDTDQIIPARYLTTTKPAELAPHCMEDADAAFAQHVQPGDMIVAGRNFGCGSSREHAPLAIMGAGVSCVIADSFARIFYRNAVNVGLPILECPEAAEAVAAGDELAVEPETGVIRNLTRRETYQAMPLSGAAGEIVAAGGLANLVRAKLQKA